MIRVTQRAFAQQPISNKATHVKRFYKKVGVVEHPMSDQLPKIQSGDPLSLQNLSLAHEKYYAVTLDGRVTKTLYQDVLALPSRALAIALAEEWDA